MGLLLNKNFELRRRIFGDAALGVLNLAMIKCAWSVNGALSQQSWALMSTCILQLHSIEEEGVESIVHINKQQAPRLGM